VPDLFENTDIVKLDLSTIFQFYRRKEIWILYFHDSKLEECKKFKDEYVSISEKLYGIIKVGAINCKEEEELCEEFGVFDIPQIVIFTENYSDDGERYRGKMEASNIMGSAAKKMQNFVSVVSSTNYDQFIERERLTKNKVLLFTEKKTTPAVFKALSKKFKEKLSFGEVRKSEEELVKAFGVT